MAKKKHNYQMIDVKSRYKHRAERLKVAQALGYDTISEALIKTYRKTRSAARTGDINLITAVAVFHFLKKWGEPRNHDKSQGARRRVL